jgi:peptidoglycan/LPS O-acetylase OafA/YrhL
VTDYVHRPLAFWCYFSNLAIAFGGDDHSSELVIFWSLAIEEQFYLCWPLMVNRFSRERLLSLCPAVMLGSLLLRCSLLVLLHDAGRIPIHFLTPCRLDGLAAGAFVALCLRGRTDWEALGRRALKVILGSGLLLMGIFARGQSAMGAVVETIGFSALAVFFAASLVLFLVLQSRDHASWAVQTCANPILRLFGRYSYAMYVFHMAVIVYFTEHLQIAQRLPTLAGSAMLAQMSFQLVIIALVLALSVASWHLYEKHFLRMKSFFPVARIGP